MSDTVTPTPVTVDELTARLTALRDVAIEIRNGAGWCSDWMPRFERISRAYTRNRNESVFNVDGNRVIAAPAFSPEHLTEAGQAHYAAWVAEQCQAELNRVGEHVRYYGSTGNISREQANQALAALGLPEIQAAAHNRYMNMPYVKFVDSETGRVSTATRDAQRAAINAAFDAFLASLTVDGLTSFVRYTGNDYIDFNTLRPEVDWGITSEPTRR